MRRSEYAMPDAEARAMLAEAATFRLATLDEQGGPLLRTLHGVMHEGALCFHGSPRGEKSEVAGRRAVVQVEELVATVPSTFFDPERACPATTYYRSVQGHGRLFAVTDPEAKAAVLAALMEKVQPEGGHRPIRADDPLYRAAVQGIAIFGVALERIDGKAKLAQNRGPEARRALLEALWRRGAMPPGPRDDAAIEELRRANPDTPTPSFLAGPPGATLHAWLPAARAEEAARLVAQGYWNSNFSMDALAGAHRQSTAWVGATDEGGRLIGTARAISDGHKRAWVYDVFVAEARRGQGLGLAVTRLLLDHPAVRRAATVHLATKDAMGLYAQLGFVPDSTLPPKGYSSTAMTLLRARRSSAPTS